MLDIINLLKKAIDELPSAFLADAQGRYLYVNPGWVRHIGYKPKDVLGKYVNDVVPNSVIDEVLRTGEPITGYPVTDKNGDTLFSNIFPLHEGGKLIGVFGDAFFVKMDEAVNFYHSLDLLKVKVEYYKNELGKLKGSEANLDKIIGNSKEIQTLKESIRQASRTSSTVLIEGETGCGKELVANAIHALSARTQMPFVKINCAAVPTELAESEFFGYASGSFTGAKRGGKIGLFETADHGSLFLDEINQMSYYMQPKLLRAIQEREIRPVGGGKTIPIDVRIIAATNKSLEGLVDEGKFRTDLFYRLNVINIKIPSLREHLEDIPDIMQASLVRLNHELGLYVEGVDPSVYPLLYSYRWPGNVRELNNVLERAMNIHPYGMLDRDCFESYFSDKKTVRSSSYLTERTESIKSIQQMKEEQERSYIIRMLEENAFNKSKTADAMGISRTALYKKIKKYGL